LVQLGATKQYVIEILGMAIDMGYGPLFTYVKDQLIAFELAYASEGF
jgi:hypothetical protein